MEKIKFEDLLKQGKISLSDNIVHIQKTKKLEFIDIEFDNFQFKDNQIVYDGGIIDYKSIENNSSDKNKLIFKNCNFMFFFILIYRLFLFLCIFKVILIVSNISKNF